MKIPDLSELLNHIFSRCIAKGECLEWNGAKKPAGYGNMKIPGTRKTGSPHRLVMQAMGCEIAGKDVCHHCDNPSCCNPEHLFIGTAIDNVRDCIKKGRFSMPPIGLRGGRRA